MGALGEQSPGPPGPEPTSSFRSISDSPRLISMKSRSPWVCSAMYLQVWIEHRMIHRRLRRLPKRRIPPWECVASLNLAVLKPQRLRDDSQIQMRLMATYAGNRSAVSIRPPPGDLPYSLPPPARGDGRSSGPDDVAGRFHRIPVVAGWSTRPRWISRPDGRLFVLEQGGNVKLVHNDGTTWTASHLNIGLRR